MTNLLRKPTEFQDINQAGAYEKFNLSENPFPSEPTVNKESTDKRINGNIYEMQIREPELDKILTNFIRQPQSNPNHYRLGYIIDSSYIGRGNGKSAFLINLLHMINKEYCLDISNDKNKCFAAYVSPEPGGRTKSFISFVDCIFNAILRSDIISISLATLRLESLQLLRPEIDLSKYDDISLIENVNNLNWYSENDIQFSEINNNILRNPHFQDLPTDFPIFSDRNTFYPSIITQKDFETYYKEIKKPKDKIDFVFSHLVKFFMGANFNGAYILVDDFERIPDFQSTRQKKDFALELRSCLFDGYYTNAKIGFFNFILVLHAGVPRLIDDAWAASGLENRAPLNQLTYNHVIVFEKLSKENVTLLLRKYLLEYRLNPIAANPLAPFTQGAINKMGELSELNAAKILRMAYELLAKASVDEKRSEIDEKYVVENRGAWEFGTEPDQNIDVEKTTDLLAKASGQEKE